MKLRLAGIGVVTHEPHENRMSKKLCMAMAGIFLISSAFAEDMSLETRPGVARLGDVCFETSKGLGSNVPCDARYDDAEKIAGWDFTFRDRKGPRAKSDFEAWQATSGIAKFQERIDAWERELNKQAVEHADASKSFLSGSCRQWEEEKTPEAWQRACQFEQSNFQRNYWFALQGDHDAQMNVADCFSNGEPTAELLDARWPCHRVVRADETQLCAWLLIAMSTGDPKSGKAAEDYGYLYECDKKSSWSERQSIFGTASDLFELIYHRPLPLAK